MPEHPAIVINAEAMQLVHWTLVISFLLCDASQGHTSDDSKCNISKAHGFWQIPSLINSFFILHKSESSFTSLNWTLIKTNFTSGFDMVLSHSIVVQGLRLSWLIPLLSNEALGCRGWSLVSSITVSVQWHWLRTLIVEAR